MITNKENIEEILNTLQKQSSTLIQDMVFQFFSDMEIFNDNKNLDAKHIEKLVAMILAKFMNSACLVFSGEKGSLNTEAALSLQQMVIKYATEDMEESVLSLKAE